MKGEQLKKRVGFERERASEEMKQGLFTGEGAFAQGAQNRREKKKPYKKEKGGKTLKNKGPDGGTKSLGEGSNTGGP